MVRPGVIGPVRAAGCAGMCSGEEELEAALTRIDALLEFENQAELARASEQRMRRALHAVGWTVMTAPGHAWNTWGPDAIAWRRGPTGRPTVMILDNKATRTEGATVYGATGLSAPSLVRHLPSFIGALSRVRQPIQQEVRYLLERSLDAARKAAAVARRAGRDPAAERIALPGQVTLVVTNACGRNLKAVSPTLRGRGIIVVDVEALIARLPRLNPPLVPCPPVAQPQLRAARLARR